MGRFIEYDKVKKWLHYAEDICCDCGIKGQACYGCDIYYDKIKFKQVIRQIEKSNIFNE